MPAIAEPARGPVLGITVLQYGSQLWRAGLPRRRQRAGVGFPGGGGRWDY